MSVESYLDARSPINVQTIPVSITSSSATVIHPRGGQGKQPLVLLSTVDCYIRFGNASVGAATNAYELFKANIPMRLDIDNATTYMTVLGTGSGTLYWYIEGDAGDTARSILGTSWVDQWDREFGATATGWTSRGGRALTATGSTTYAADGTNFKAQPVPGAGAGFSNFYFEGTGFTGLPAISSLAWVGIVTRARSSNGLTQGILSVRGGTSEVFRILSNGGVNFQGRINGSNFDASFADFGVHLHELWLDGSTAGYAIDGTTQFSLNTGAGTIDAITTITIGNLLTHTNPEDSAFSRIVLASPAPTAGQRAQLLSLFKQQDGF